MGGALIAEYEDVMGRDNLWKTCGLSATERDELLDIFLSKCDWIKVYFAWRPNLRDDADNHIVELAVAGQANAIVTRNVRDLRSGELRFPGIGILTPRQLLQEFET